MNFRRCDCKGKADKYGTVSIYILYTLSDCVCKNVGRPVLHIYLSTFFYPFSLALFILVIYFYLFFLFFVSLLAIGVD